MVVVPANTPVTTPVPATTVAIVVPPLLQVPPVVASLRVVVAPLQTWVVPEMVTGNGLTVTVSEDEHPVGKV